MKKNLVLLFLFLPCVLLALFGCCKEKGLNVDITGQPVEVTFIASIDKGIGSKTSYDATNHIGFWKREDMVGVIASYGPKSLTDARMQNFNIQNRNHGGNEFLSTAVFTGKLIDKGIQTYTYYALYPYTAFQTVTDVSAVSSRLEERQYPDLKSWDGACDMLASKPVTVTSSSVAADNLQLEFTRLFGMLRLRFSTSITDTYGSETVETISIESANASDKLAGVFTIDLTSTEAPDPVISSTAGETFNKVTLDYRGRNSTLSNIDAYFVMNPGVYDNVTITIKTRDHTLTLPRTNLTVSRGCVSSATLNWKAGDAASASTPLLPKNPESLKILTLGHSYAADTMEYIDDLLNESCITNIIFANLYQANCSLQEFWGHATNEGNTKGGTDRMSFYKRYYDGNAIVESPNMPKTVIDALCDEQWDIVVFQTAIEYEGVYDQINQPLQDLIDYVKVTCKTENNKVPTLAWHMFWAMSSKCTKYARFDVYDRNPEQNYAAHIQAAKQIMRNHDIQLVIPSGTTIQSLRHSSINNSYELTRDGYHMDEGAGRYATACTWFEYFMKPCFGISVLGNMFIPSTYTYFQVTEENREFLQRAAVLACQNPFEISHLDAIDGRIDVTGSTETFESSEKGSTETFTIIDNLTW